MTADELFDEDMLPKTLKHLSPRQLHGVSELGMWFCDEPGFDPQGLLQTALVRTSGPGSLHHEDHWFRMALRVSGGADNAREQVTGRRSYQLPDYAPLSQFAIFDQFQEYAEEIPGPGWGFPD